MASKKKSQWRLRYESFIEPEVDRRGKWTCGLEVEVFEIDLSLNRTFYYLTFRWNGNDGYGGQTFVIKTQTGAIPSNLRRGEWASHAQTKGLLRRMLPMASKAAMAEYNAIVEYNPIAAV